MLNYHLETTCPICLNGWIGFWRCSDGETIILICDECDSIWADPNDASDAHKMLHSTARDNYIAEIDCYLTGQASGPATLPDIERKGWLSFIDHEVGNEGHTGVYEDIRI